MPPQVYSTLQPVSASYNIQTRGQARIMLAPLITVFYSALTLQCMTPSLYLMSQYMDEKLFDISYMHSNDFICHFVSTKGVYLHSKGELPLDLSDVIVKKIPLNPILTPILTSALFGSAPEQKVLRFSLLFTLLRVIRGTSSSSYRNTFCTC